MVLRYFCSVAFAEDYIKRVEIEVLNFHFLIYVQNFYLFYLFVCLFIYLCHLSIHSFFFFF